MICLEFVDLIYTLVYIRLGVIMYPGNQQYIVTYASGQPVMATAYPPGISPHYVSYAGKYPSQASISQPSSCNWD